MYQPNGGHGHSMFPQDVDRNATLDLEAVIFDADTLICKAGEPSYCAYLIKEGKAEVFRQVGPRRVVIARLGPGEMFGEMSMIEDRPYRRNVRAVTEVEAHVIFRDDFQYHVNMADPFILFVMKTLARRLRRTTQVAYGGSDVV